MPPALLDRHAPTARSALEGLLEVLVPSVCVACRRGGDVARGDPLCRSCRLSLPWLDASRGCPRCGLPERCAPRTCPARGQAFDGAWSPLAYAGAVPALVVGLKERGALRLARLMAAQLAATAPPGTWAPGVALVPVPADPLRRRRRGVDHAATLARELAPRVGLPVAACLTRARAPAQAGRARRARLGTEVGTRTRGEIPATAILVDDVHTTGATLHACALALRAGGAERVRAVTYARTLT
jgi:predicted amidophosphoribosyltransferase